MLDEIAYRTAKGLADSVFVASRIFGGQGVSSLRETIDYRSLGAVFPTLTNEQTQAKIADLLLGSGPCLISRLGSTEARVMIKHHGRKVRTIEEKVYAAVARFESPVWSRREHLNLQKKSGFYPITEHAVERFAAEMYRAMTDVDLLGSWVPGENKLASYFPDTTFTDLAYLSPFGSPKPWTQALEGKRVLVIHPFEESIRKQFKKLNVLFSSDNFMPNFSLQTIKAVQSLGTPPAEFSDWFAGLEHMHDEARRKDFDIAIIACGSYGFPLGARIKRDGKKAVVLGGILQLLFGIKGKRWDGDGLYNENWIRPIDAEKPDGFFGADRGAYW